MDDGGEAAAAAGRRGGNNGTWEIVLVRRERDPTTAGWSDRYVKLFLLWSAAIAVSAALYIFAGYVWGSVAAAAFLLAGCWLTFCRCCLKQPPPELLPVDADVGPLRVAVIGQVNGGGGLSQAEIDAVVPVFEYQRKKEEGASAAAEQCAVCINVVRDGEAVRRLPACAHTFHAPCIDGWLRAHATCPMCRADVKVKVAAPADVGPPPVPEESSAAA